MLEKGICNTVEVKSPPISHGDAFDHKLPNTGPNIEAVA